MQKRILSQLIAVVILIALVLSSFGTTAIAISEEITANQENLRTSTRFVEANLAFVRGEETFTQMVADVNDQELKFRLFLDLKDAGYLHGGQIEIRNPENLTFEFVEPEKKSELIQSVESQVIKLSQIKGVSETYLEVPIKYIGVDNVNSKYLLNKNEFVLTGEYTNEQGKKFDVSKKVDLVLNWVDKKEATISNSVSKYIKYEIGETKGVVLQNLVKVSNKKNNVILPIQKVVAETNLVKIENQLPKIVNVSVQNAKLLNDDGKIVLDKEIFKWDEAKNLLRIEIENSQNEDGTYSAGSGDLEFLITSIYEVDAKAAKYQEDMNLQVKQFVLTGDSKLNEIQKDNKTKIILDKAIGKIVDANETVDVKQIAKGILYVNSRASQLKENIVKSRMKLDISNTEIVDSILVYENEPQYNNGVKETNFEYKTLEINKKEFDSVFGEGYIDIYSGDKILGRIDNKSEEVNQKYIFRFTTKASSLVLQTSKPQGEGEVYLDFVRSLGKSRLDINSLKGMKTLETKKSAYVEFGGKRTLLKEMNHKIELVNASSKITVSTNRNELSTIKKNENIEFVIALNNDKLTSDIYGQTVIEMLLPKGIKDFKLKGTNLVHANGLKVQSSKVVKYGQQFVLQIILSGVQNGLSTGHLSNGANIVVNTDLVLDEWATSQKTNYQVLFTNTLATNYANPSNWGMTNTFANFKKFGSGIAKGSLDFVAPKGVVLIDEYDNFNRNKQNVISIHQGYKEGKLDVLTGKRIANGNIYLLNNSGSEVTNPTILGRLPNKENKNIFTGAGLGNTFDTTLLKGLQSQSGLFKVYYSKNPNATNNLKEINNQWVESINIKDAKSYLIVLEDKMPNGKMYKFNYQLEVPENLEHNQKVQTYSLVEYGVNTKTGNVRYYQMASPIGLSTGEGVQLNIDIKADKDKVSENEEITYTLDMKNEAIRTDAKNVESYFRIPDNLEFKGMKDDATGTKFRLSDDKKGVFLTMGDIKVGNSISKELVFTAKQVKNDEKVELTVNTKADNFEVVKSEKALGTSIEAKKLSVVIENTGDLSDNSRVNIYPNIDKEYKVRVKNNTGFVFDQKDGTASLGDVLGKVNLRFNLPPTVEYVREASPLYRVVSYNTLTNVLELELNSEELGQGSSVEFTLPIRLKKQLPTNYNRNIDIMAVGTSTVLGTNQIVTTNSNKLGVYIAPLRLNVNGRVYSYNTRSQLTSIKEYNDIVVRYDLSASYPVLDRNLVFEATDGLIVKAVYKNATHGAQKTALALGGVTPKGNNRKVYTYPFYIPSGGSMTVYVHAQVPSLGEATSKTFNCDLSLENVASSKTSVSFTATKGQVQSGLLALHNSGKVDLSPADKKKYGLGAGRAQSATNSVLGKAWIDTTKDGIQSMNDKPLGKVQVELVDNATQKVVARTVTDDNGNYQFDNVVNGNYSAVFKYDDKMYTPTIYNAKGDLEENSKGIRVNNDSVRTSVAVTDGIQVNFASVKNVDLGLVEKSNFDLKLDSEITNVKLIADNKEDKILNFNNKKTIKVELDRSALNKTKAHITYLVQVTNEGDLDGNVLKVNAYIPEGLRFIPEENRMWETDSEGNIFTTAFSTSEIKPEQSQQLELILEKDINNESLGLSVVGFEIAEAKNNLGLFDRDSTPNNLNVEEDDYANVELVIGLNTGKKVAYTLLILTTIAIIGTTIFLFLRKINGKEIK